MIVQMQADLWPEDQQIKDVVARAKELGLEPHVVTNSGAAHTVTEVHLKDGDTPPSALPTYHFERMNGVECVRRVTPSAVGLRVGDFQNPFHHIAIAPGVTLGTGLPCRLIAGPCTVDPHIGRVMDTLAHEHGISLVRGGCWKPRSQARGFPGHGAAAVQWVLEAAQDHGVTTVFTEVMDTSHVDIVRRTRDKVGYRGQIVLWVGARTANQELLRTLGEQDEFVVMLKNPIDMARIAEWTSHAEFVLTGRPEYDVHGRYATPQVRPHGNERIILCWRGLGRTDPQSLYRGRPQPETIADTKRLVWAPVGVDPSHSAGTMDDDLVFTNLAAALVHKPAFVLLETESPDALCDKAQAMPFDRLPEVIKMISAHNKMYYGESTY